MKRSLQILAATVGFLIAFAILAVVWRWVDTRLKAHNLVRIVLLIVFVPVTAGFLSATLEWLWYVVLCRRSLATVNPYGPMKIIALGLAIAAAISHTLSWLYVAMGVLFLCRGVKRDLEIWAGEREAEKGNTK